MSGLFGATTIPGNRLTDIAATTSTVGIPLPFGYGRFPVDGNIIWSAGRPTEHVTKKKQGKGGVKTQEYTYTLSYAIGFCAGPIYGYLTILRQGKVVFTTDPNATIEDKAYAAKWAQKCTMYFGTRTQMPDSTIEAKEGAGKVSAFRDLAYIVVEDDDVTDNGGGVPQYEAVVIASPPEVYVTSRPYALTFDDTLLFSILKPSNGNLKKIIEGFDAGSDFFSVSVAPKGGTLNAPSEAFTCSDVVEILPAPSGGTLKAPGELIQFSESLDLSIVPTSGLLKSPIIPYSTQDVFSVAVAPSGGTLE